MATANLRLSFGAMYIGCVISVSFSGIAALQAYFYFRKYGHRDSRRMKSTVMAAWLLDVTHTVFICQGVWHYLVLSWGDLSELDHLTWTVGMSIAITGLITITVHLFFANRVWRLSRHNIWITSLICGLAVIRFGSALTTTAQMLRLERFSTFISDFRWLFTFGLALSSIIDVIITGALCYYLRSNVTGYSSIDDTIHRITLYTINNGLLTCFASLIDMICAASMPHNFLFLSLHFIIAKCYVNSLLSTLNSRDALRDREDSHPMAVHISVENGASAQPRLFRRQLSQGHVSSKEHTRSGSNSSQQNRSMEIAPSSTPFDNVKDARKYGIMPTPPLSPSSSVFPSSQDSHAYPPSPPPVFSVFPSAKVHINVERTIHNDDGVLEAVLESPYRLGKEEHGDDKDSMTDNDRDSKDMREDFP